jgi:hypothetical protein
MMEKRSKTRQRKPSGVKESQRLRAALDHTKRRIQELAEEREADRREIAELRRVVAEQTEQLETLTARVELVTSREPTWRRNYNSRYRNTLLPKPTPSPRFPQPSILRSRTPHRACIRVTNNGASISTTTLGW